MCKIRWVGVQVAFSLELTICNYGDKSFLSIMRFCSLTCRNRYYSYDPVWYPVILIVNPFMWFFSWHQGIPHTNVLTNTLLNSQEIPLHISRVLCLCTSFLSDTLLWELRLRWFSQTLSSISSVRESTSLCLDFSSLYHDLETLSEK